MKKQMHYIRVETVDNDTIQIVGEAPVSPGETMVEAVQFSPDQVDTLIQWLQEAKAELRNTPDAAALRA